MYMLRRAETNNQSTMSSMTCVWSQFQTNNDYNQSTI